MPPRSRTPVKICRELLSLINRKGKALKNDLIKNLGSEAAFTRWLDRCLIPHKIVECFQEKRGKRTFTYFQKTNSGELLHETLKNHHIIKVWLRISGKRLKPEEEAKI